MPTVAHSKPILSDQGARSEETSLVLIFGCGFRLIEWFRRFEVLGQSAPAPIFILYENYHMDRRSCRHPGSLRRGRFSVCGGRIQEWHTIQELSYFTVC
jgi:hypothetical protein